MNTSNGTSPYDCQKDVTEESDHLVTFRITIYVFIIGFLCLFGFAGNAISITVLRKDRDTRNTTFWLLQTLAVADTLCLFTSVFIYTLQTITDYTDWWLALKRTYPRIQPYVWPCASIAQTTTVWIILLITIHRFIAVSKPLRARSMNPIYIKVAAILIYVTAVLYNITAFFERKTVVCEDGSLHVTRTAFGKNNDFFLVYHIILHSLFKTIGPLFVLIILTFGLIKELKKAQKQQEHLTRNGARDHNITFMLVVVVTVFIFCELPDTVWRILYNLKIHKIHISDEFNTRSNIIIHILLVLNSAVNFLIYGFTGTQFRNDLKMMFCHKEQSKVYTDTTAGSNLSLDAI